MTPKKRLRVLIADDHVIVRVGLVSMLANEDDLDVVAEAGSADEAVSLFRQHRSDVALFDVRMPHEDGISALRRVRAEFPDACVLMLSTAELDEEVATALDAGASGYVTKTSDLRTLAGAIRAVARGEQQFSSAVQRRLAERKELSPRELEVLAGMARGQSNKEIAQALFLSEHTVKTYARTMLIKLEATDRAGAVAIAFARGILKI